VRSAAQWRSASFALLHDEPECDDFGVIEALGIIQ